MLGRLGLQFTRSRDIGQQGHVDEERPLRPDLVAELTDRLEERQALDVAHRAANLAQDEVLVADVAPDEVLDGVGHVRKDLQIGRASGWERVGQYGYRSVGAVVVKKKNKDQ